jgi:hypothetical protein
MFDPRTSPLEQWVSRIDHRLRLPGLREKEVREIATAELSQVSERAMATLLEQCQADDRVTRRKYYSARYLFKIIRQYRNSQGKGSRKVH